MNKLDQASAFGRMLKSDYQFVYVLGSVGQDRLTGTLPWSSGPLRLVHIVNWGWFAAQELWKDCEEHWKQERYAKISKR